MSRTYNKNKFTAYSSTFESQFSISNNSHFVAFNTLISLFLLFYLLLNTILLLYFIILYILLCEIIKISHCIKELTS